MDLAPVVRFAVLLVRPGMIVLVAPGFGGTYAPAPVKIALTALLAVALLPAVAVPPIGGTASLGLVVAREAAIGLALAFVVRALIAGAELAGHLAGYQIGFSYAATIDPQSGVRNSVVTLLYGMLATLAFLAVNGHHDVLRALAASYAGMPIGTGDVHATLLDGVRQTFAVVFTVGVRLAAPVIIVLLVVEIAVGLISRAAPALNFLVIGYPLRLVVGLAVLSLLVVVVPEVTGGLVERVIEAAMRFAAAFR